MGDDMIVLTSDMGNLVYSKEITDQLDNTDLSLLKDFDIVSFQVPLPLKETHNWIEIDSETRSKNVNKLSNEFAQFISRYGVRLIDNK